MVALSQNYMLQDHLTVSKIYSIKTLFVFHNSFLYKKRQIQYKTMTGLLTHLIALHCQFHQFTIAICHLCVLLGPEARGSSHMVLCHCGWTMPMHCGMAPGLAITIGRFRTHSVPVLESPKTCPWPRRHC